MPDTGTLNQNNLSGQNPYKFPVGPELDEIIHKLLFENDGGVAPAYSTDLKEANKVKARLRRLFGHTVNSGRTSVKLRPYFARFESGASTSTEVLAETFPAAVCRLALVIAPGRERRS